MFRSMMGLLAGALVVGTLVGPASAQPIHAQPGSVLIFPLYNSTQGNNTVLTVTNLNEDENSCGNGFRQGDVELHYVYYSETWQESDTDEQLTPADTLTVLARGHNPNFEMGFLVVEARDPETGLAIDFDFLIGSAIIVNSEFDFEWAYTPYVFEALPGRFERGLTDDACGRLFLDPAGDPDELTMDFDGRELSAFPDTLYLDHFFGEGTPAGRPAVSFGNTLYLMSSSPGGLGNSTNVALVGWNNNEKRFSRSFSFDCYYFSSLGEITNAVSQTNLDVDSDDSELLGVEYGWLRLTATNGPESGHALLGVYTDAATIGGDVFTSGRELQYSGSRSVTIPRTF